MIPKTTIVPLAWKAQAAYAAGAGTATPEARTLAEWAFAQRCRAAFFATLGTPSQHTFLRQQKHAAIYLPRRN